VNQSKHELLHLKLSFETSKHQREETFSQKSQSLTSLEESQHKKHVELRKTEEQLAHKEKELYHKEQHLAKLASEVSAKKAQIEVTKLIQVNPVRNLKINH